MNDQDQANHANETTVHEQASEVRHETNQAQDDLARGEAGEGGNATLRREAEALAQAQAQLAEATSRIADLAAKLNSETLARQLRDGLEDAGAVRVREALRAAIALAPASSDSAAISGAIDKVRAAHPDYFAQGRWPTTNAPAADGDASSKDGVSALAARARATNDRRALLDYLRARRAK